jgi:dipeptidyl aminopeptidase/acylaminoacyl peptidase
MRRITWHQLLGVGMLLASLDGLAQAPPRQGPQAIVRELATIEGDNISDFVLLPSRGALLYVCLPGEESTFIYDIATKRRTLLGTNMVPQSVSPQGDRLAFTRYSEDRTEGFVWTMPIDPKTGIATGQAQRVSLRPFNAGRPVFSPDGKMIAFNSRRPDGTYDVTLVPSTGGAERVVANYPGRRPMFGWSADGQSLYVQDSELSIQRVPVAGGQRETLVPRTLITARDAVGFSPDMRVAFFHQRPDRFFYRTASHVEGEISATLPTLDAGGGYTLGLDSSMRFAMMTHVWNQGVRVLDLTSGQSRDLLPGNVQTRSPAWSPDGRRLAVLIGNRSQHDIAIMNADGSGLRRYPTSLHLKDWEGAMPWSPDGRFLLFRATDRPEVSSNPYDEHQLALLDIVSGKTRVLATISPGIFGGFWWRTDGKAIRARRSSLRPEQRAETGPLISSWVASLVEIDLDGKERLLRDVSAEFREPTRIAFVGDHAVVLAVKLGRETERLLVPLDGGSARRLRRLPEPGGDPRLPGPLGTPIAKNRLLVQSRPEVPVVSILSTAGDSTSSVNLPTGTLAWRAHPNGEHIVAIVGAAGQTVHRIFLVPLGRGTPQFVGEIPRASGPASLALSPDGKLLAYTADGLPTTKILEVDFGPAFQTIVKQ